MADDDEQPWVRQELIGPGEVIELTKEDIGENETLQIIGVLATPAGSVPPRIRTPNPRGHTPVQVGGGVTAWVIDPHTVITGDDMISFPRSVLGTTHLWSAGEPTTPHFVVLMRDTPEDTGG